MDLIIFIILIMVVVFYFKDFKSVVYFLGITEIFFRLVHIIKSKIAMVELTKIVNTYIPTSLSSILAKYANGLLYDVMIWGLIALFVCFEFYLIKFWIKKKKWFSFFVNILLNKHIIN